MQLEFHHGLVGARLRRVARWGGSAALGLWLAAPAAAQWPQFRGPAGDGHATSRNPPTEWAEGKNVRWKTAIHGRAWSSPVILGDQVWVSTATPDGRELSVLALDKASGKVLRDLKLFQVDSPQFAHAFNTYASPTPVIEPGRIYVTFGSPGTAAVDTASGKVLWTRRDLECNHYRGAGSSPILFENLLIMHFDGSDHQYVVALDKTSGKTVWQTKRSVDYKDLGPDGTIQAEGDFRKAFATPHIITVSGAPLLLSLGSKATYGYDPRTGREIWRIEEPSAFSASTRPVVGHGLVYYPSGFSAGQLLAIRPDGKGDATATHIAWRMTRNVPNKPSLLLVDDLLFMVGDTGILNCVDAKTGESVWRARVDGTFSASPVVAAGHIYIFNEDGKATVFEAGPAFKPLAENLLDGGVMASPAFDGDALYVRTKTHLYRIEAGELGNL